MSNDYSINRRVDGNYVIMNELEDAPLVTVLFHNEAARVPDEIKVVLIRQMFDPVPPKMALGMTLGWLMFGFVLGLFGGWLGCVAMGMR